MLLLRVCGSFSRIDRAERPTNSFLYSLGMAVVKMVCPSSAQVVVTADIDSER
jgi:hypothetical protein